MGVLCALLLAWMTTAIAWSAPTFRMLLSFDGVDGDGPYAALVQAANGDLYGTTSEGGPNYGAGTIFKITPNGVLTTLHTFQGTDGSSPGAALIQADDGDLYGTTQTGGANSPSCQLGCGTIYKITPKGAFKTLYRFIGVDGAYPYGGLVQAKNGDFYGTTQYRGAFDAGTVFKFTPNGRLITLHNFRGSDGSYPFAGLIQATDGDLYGTTDDGGDFTHGTVFKITTSGRLTTLHSFNGNDGGYPRSGLVQATGGDLFGTTEYGAYAGGQYAGTVFRISTGGKFRSLHTFDGTDGANPYGGLIWATDGNLFGTTLNGGVNGDGSVFEITPNGTLTSLYSFQNTQAYPFAGLVQGTDGIFYGTTYEGGSGNCGGFFCGMVFSLSVSGERGRLGLAPR